MTSDQELDRRFEGTINLYGVEAFSKIKSAHIMILGLGGVGSWAAESLARSGVMNITLVDLDDLCISNTNRQVHATQNNYGKMKVQAMKERIHEISPNCNVDAIEDFCTAKTLPELIPSENSFDYVLDAIDSSLNKAILIDYCLKIKTKIITIGASGGKTDPTQIQIKDLNRTEQDNLLSTTRRTLKKQLGYRKVTKLKLFYVPAVYSPEQTNHASDIIKCDLQSGAKNCQSGMGSASYVTGSFAFVACSRIINDIIK